MGRHLFKPHDFGINMEKDDFVDLLVNEFREAFRGAWSIDELVLHPRDALRFCDDLRRKHSYYDLPDDIILRSLMGRRKNP